MFTCFRRLVLRRRHRCSLLPLPPPPPFRPSPTRTIASLRRHQIATVPGLVLFQLLLRTRNCGNTRSVRHRNDTGFRCTNINSPIFKHGANIISREFQASCPHKRQCSYARYVPTGIDRVSHKGKPTKTMTSSI